MLIIKCQFIMIVTLGGTRVLYRSRVKGSLQSRFKDLLRTEPVRRLAYAATGIFTAFALRPSILNRR